jgi:hypothetical protein
VLGSVAEPDWLDEAEPVAPLLGAWTDGLELGALEFMPSPAEGLFVGTVDGDAAAPEPVVWAKADPAMAIDIATARMVVFIVSSSFASDRRTGSGLERALSPLAPS